jgi:hypothetical protein
MEAKHAMSPDVLILLALLWALVAASIGMTVRAARRKPRRGRWDAMESDETVMRRLYIVFGVLAVLAVLAVGGLVWWFFGR